ncbi:unnamed protein product [Vitrella brassicaformis CCMP3155]|uniref:Mitochondrial inner membrane protease subunit 2 n=1 Tax=Vitrella brassicaformis (strain CCMP3155) TaxID=1169540 RepID=A0A0G4GWP0_VITBC|nr:unnamed protein product [Vitrella brassicaformis CCMP3155]|mmetsp:Transcript_22943/g.56688  ORF Transcript_22943/g.56688 Transcript_22943/m.56688 type:complete len:224 (-) Transcript_22943:224-895(-)|eukprot:CEM35372.1 unnamed protein product [Vitrella brassicaformis CCMP3155]
MSRRFFLRSGYVALSALPVGVLINDRVCSIARVEGDSMQPTLNPIGPPPPHASTPPAPRPLPFISRGLHRDVTHAEAEPQQDGPLPDASQAAPVREYVFVVKNVDFRKGDVVVMRDPEVGGDPRWSLRSRRVMKRIVGMQNDTVCVRKDEREEFPPIVIVPTGKCWVQGDNPAHSVDSRHYGAVPLGLVEALVLAVVWPPSRWRQVDHGTPPSLTTPTQPIGA